MLDRLLTGLLVLLFSVVAILYLGCVYGPSC